MVDFKNINIMVGIAALFSTVSLKSYSMGSDSHLDMHKDKKYKIESKSRVYTVLTPVKNIVPENLKGYKEYDDYAHSLMMSNSSQVFLTKDIGNNFVIYMIPHHEAAIVASAGVLKYTQNKEVKSLAQRIISEQEKEVEIMQALLQSGELRGNENPEYLKKMQKINMMMMKNMNFYEEATKDSEKITEHYLKNMIFHHKGALEMAKEYLKYGKNEELIKLAHKVILTQEEEIKEINKILKQAN
ncbi:MAG: DUF305 domain-containing protein [Fusobacteriaceae bacterium]